MHLSLAGVVRLVLLLAAVAITWSIARQQRVDAPDELARPLPPGYYLKSAVLSGTDGTGQLIYNVAAELAEERPTENRILLTNVRVNYRAAAQVPWDISSQNGIAQLDQSYIDLFGQVELTSAPQPPETETLIFTDAMRLRPEEFVAETAERVQIQMGGRELRATGLVAYLKEDRLELQSNVNGQFRP
jgi:lipopolysaccharide export system protein LptC